jgi:hypothetical protein
VGDEPIIVWLAKLIPLVSQDAVEQRFGWLNERPKMRWINSRIFS